MNFTDTRAVKIRNVALWVIAIALLINVARIIAPRLRTYAQDLASQAKPIRTYTSTLQETVYDPSGHAEPSIAIYTWAVRSDGSLVVRSEILDGPKTMQRNISFASGEQVSIDEREHMKSTTTYSEGNAASWLRDPQSKCLTSLTGQPIKDGEVVLGSEDVNSYPTVKIVLKTEKENMTFWDAPNYGCAPVKFEAIWGDGAKTEQTLTSLLPGEPSPTLFDVPSNFAEVAPSKMLPGPISPGMAQRIDAKYYTHHVR